MLQTILQGIEKGVSQELTKLTARFFVQLKKRVFAIVLQTILFAAAAMFLLLGFILWADNFIPLEYVLLLFGTVLFTALIIATKK